LIKVQNGVQPRRLNPVQSSDDARKAIGADINRAALILRSPISTPRIDAGVPERALTPMTIRAKTTRAQKGTAISSPIALKSIANRRRRRAEITHATNINGLTILTPGYCCST